ncbi:unnamed protein product [Chrysoparadoxa australica]
MDDPREKKSLKKTLKLTQYMSEATYVEVPPQELFTFLCDLERWIPRINHKFHDMSCTRPPAVQLGPGSRYEATYTERGARGFFMRAPDIVEQHVFSVTECSCPTRLQILHTSPGVTTTQMAIRRGGRNNATAPDQVVNPPAVLEFTLTPHGQGTNLVLKIHPSVIHQFTAIEAYAKWLIFLPCFWPHMCILGCMVCCSKPCIASQVADAMSEKLYEMTQKLKHTAEDQRRLGQGTGSTSVIAVATATPVMAQPIPSVAAQCVQLQEMEAEAPPQYSKRDPAATAADDVVCDTIPSSPSAPPMAPPQAINVQPVSVQLVQPSPPLSLMRVSVPVGAAAGTILEVLAPNGQTLQVQVPEGLPPGSMIEVAY